MRDDSRASCGPPKKIHQKSTKKIHAVQLGQGDAKRWWSEGGESPHFLSIQALTEPITPKSFRKRCKDTLQTVLQHGIVAKKFSDEYWMDFGAFEAAKRSNSIDYNYIVIL